MTAVDGMVAAPSAAGGREVPARSGAPVPCVARPGAGLVHRDGPCGCFFGGPPPEFLGPTGPA